VVDDIGVIGQVTRVFPLTSEVLLLTDKDQAIPVRCRETDCAPCWPAPAPG
jgi:cell shape-determining protein MreC